MSHGGRSGFLGKTGTDDAPLDKTYYNILNVSSTASAAEIKRAYYTLSLQYHPDRTQDLDEFTRREYAERFKLISQAYAILSDPEKRTLYNRHGKDERLASNDASSMSMENIDMGEFFRYMFGGEDFTSIVGDYELPRSFKNSFGDILREDGQTAEQHQERQMKDMINAAERASAREERISQLSVYLISKLSLFTDAVARGGAGASRTQALNQFLEIARSELPTLLQAPYGQQLLHSIGYVYSFKARFWLGKMDAQEGHFGKRILGVGRHMHSSWRDRAHRVKETVKTVKSAVQMGQTMSKLSQANDDDDDAIDSQQPFFHHSGHLEYSGPVPPPTPPEVRPASTNHRMQRKSSTQPVAPLTEEEKRRLEGEAVAKTMETLWRVVKLEVEGVERDVCDRVLNDSSCSSDILRSRCIALAELGQLWRRAAPSASS